MKLSVVTYDNIKGHKKLGLHSFSEKHIFGKAAGGGSKWPPSFFRFNIYCLFSKELIPKKIAFSNGIFTLCTSNIFR